MTIAVETCGGECTTYLDGLLPGGRVVMNITRGPRMEEVRRESIGERWCFAHRGYADFVFVVMAPVEPSYYDPMPSIICTKCGQVNGDCGFGRERLWD